MRSNHMQLQSTCSRQWLSRIYVKVIVYSTVRHTQGTHHTQGNRFDQQLLNCITYFLFYSLLRATNVKMEANSELRCNLLAL